MAAATASYLAHKECSILLARSADKAQRKLDKPLRILIKAALEKIAKDPEAHGEKLCSPLSTVYSHHITYQGREFRIAYQFFTENDSVIILLIGPHENFYKKLKNYLDAAS